MNNFDFRCTLLANWLYSHVFHHRISWFSLRPTTLIYPIHDHSYFKYKRKLMKHLIFNHIEYRYKNIWVLVTLSLNYESTSQYKWILELALPLFKWNAVAICFSATGYLKQSIVSNHLCVANIKYILGAKQDKHTQ